MTLVVVVCLLLLGCACTGADQWVSPERSCGDDEYSCYGRWDGAELCVGKVREVTVGQTTSIVAYIRSENSTSDIYAIGLEVEQDWIVSIPAQVEIEANNCTVITIYADTPGKTSLSFVCSNESHPENISGSCPFTKENLHLSHRLISVARSLPLNVIILVVGWIYAVAGIVSFYPQIFHNFRRRSVEGLSFDFLGLNFTGGLAYAMFNVGLYVIPQVKVDYFHRHPGGVNPVLLNDVVFSVNAAFAQGLLILQCFILKRGKQRVSYSGILIICLLWAVMIVSLFVSVGGVVAWLDYLYIISYIKLAVTPIKYIPQIWTIFRIKSTIGFSVGYTILEIIGGSFSVLQMFLLSYNYDDWKSIFGDPTKFGFGTLTVFFALILLFQHLLYRSNNYENSSTDTSTPDKVEEAIAEELDEKIEMKEKTTQLETVVSRRASELYDLGLQS